MDNRTLVDVISEILQKACEMNPDQKLFKRLSHTRAGSLCSGSSWSKASKQKRGDGRQALLLMEKCKQRAPQGLGSVLGLHK